MCRAPVEAATITVAYAAGHRDVTINGYGTPALGTFMLRDGGNDMVALCVEADSHHTTARDAYSLVPNRVSSPELDVLLWLLGSGTGLDADTATGAAALAWYYGGAKRNIGVPVWADGSKAFAPVTPTSPEAWNALARFSLAHPVGLRSGVTDIDGAERRVFELHQQARALAGPWSLTADPAGRRVRLTGAAGAIAGRDVTFTIAAPGTAESSTTATTDAGGWATPTLPDLADGGTISATVSAPGVHREWDGAPGVQRMVTAITTTVSTTFAIAPVPRFVTVRKTSSDPAFTVDGAEFALLGANGVIANATTGTDGMASFPPVDPATAPGPYAVRELTPPPGLLASPSDTPVPAPSHDRAHPTVVEIADEPARVPVRIRKLFSEPIDAADLSGFVFTVRRTDGGLDDQVVTDVDGLTDTARLTIGDFEVCETTTPGWASGFEDGGCIHVAIALGDLGRTDPIVYQYLNIVPTTTAPPTTTTTTAPTATITTTAITTTTVPPTTLPIIDATTSTVPVVEALPPAPTTSTTAPPRALPRTGGGAGRLLGLADIAFVAGVAMIAITGLLSRRPERETAGR